MIKGRRINIKKNKKKKKWRSNCQMQKVNTTNQIQMRKQPRILIG